MSKIDSMEGFKDYISRQQAIDKMQELEDEDIELFGYSIPEGFDGKRAIVALKTLPSVQPRVPKFIIKSDGTIEQIKNCDALDKIRAKIERGFCKVNNDYDRGRNYGLYMAIQIIDKYKAESEG